MKNCYTVLDQKYRLCIFCNKILTKTAIKRHHAIYHSHEGKSPKTVSTTSHL